MTDMVLKYYIGCCSDRFLLLKIDGSFHKGDEQRVGFFDLAAQLGVELHTDEPGVVFQLDDLHQVLLRVYTNGHHPFRFVVFQVFIIEFKAMAVTLENGLAFINFESFRLLK